MQDVSFLKSFFASDTLLVTGSEDMIVNDNAGNGEHVLINM